MSQHRRVVRVKLPIRFHTAKCNRNKKKIERKERKYLTESTYWACATVVITLCFLSDNFSSDRFEKRKIAWNEFNFCHAFCRSMPFQTIQFPVNHTQFSLNFFPSIFIWENWNYIQNAEDGDNGASAKVEFEWKSLVIDSTPWKKKPEKYFRNGKRSSFFSSSRCSRHICVFTCRHFIKLHFHIFACVAIAKCKRHTQTQTAAAVFNLLFHFPAVVISACTHRRMPFGWQCILQRTIRIAHVATLTMKLAKSRSIIAQTVRDTMWNNINIDSNDDDVATHSIHTVFTVVAIVVTICWLPVVVDFQNDTERNNSRVWKKCTEMNNKIP